MEEISGYEAEGQLKDFGNDPIWMGSFSHYRRSAARFVRIPPVTGSERLGVMDRRSQAS